MRFIRYALLATFLVGAPACSHKVTPATPRAAAALTADAIVIRVNELQATVIQLCGVGATCAPGTISTQLHDQIVQTCINVRTVLKSVPNGWQSTVKTAWAAGKARFGVVTNPAITAAIGAVDILIGGL